MDPFGMIGSIVAGGLNLIGTNMQNKQAAANQQNAQDFNAQQAASAQSFNAQEAEKARTFNSAEAGIGRDFNAMEAEKARQFVNQQSSTAYQRATADMKAAGINPMLAYMKGGADTGGSPAASSGSASGPSASGSGASTSAAPVQNLLSGAVGSAMQAMRLKPEIANIEQQNANLKESEKLTRRETELRERDAVKRVAETSLTLQELLTEQERTKVMKKEGKAADIEKGYLESDAGHILRLGHLGGKDLGTTFSTAKGVVDAFKPRRSTIERTTNKTRDGNSTFEERWSN